MTTTKSRQTYSDSYKANRAKLRELSAIAKKMVETEQVHTVNQGLIQMYSNDGHEEFKTFHEWKQEGMSIKKGSKAFLVWAKPKTIEHPDPDSDEDEMDYFPICYLFSNKQVTERRGS